MAAPAVAAAVKAAVAVVTDKKLRKIVGGIILGVIIIIVAPIAILLGIGDVGSSIDWQSPEMQQHIYDNMTDEQKSRLQAFADTMDAIDNEITAQGLDVEPIKAQVIFLCTLRDRDVTDTLYSDFVSCFAGGADDETVFANLADKFGVTLTAEEKETILKMCESAIASATVPPTAFHIGIGALLASDDTPLNPDPFTSPFKGLDWKAAVSSNYGNRKDPFTGEKSKHSGMDLQADAGTPIYPIKSGVVLFVRNDEDGYGKHLAINHGGKQVSIYAHCSEILVAEGDEVDTDTMIAKVGSTGRSTGDHLHLEIIIDGNPKNPKKYLEVNTP